MFHAFTGSSSLRPFSIRRFACSRWRWPQPRQLPSLLPAIGQLKILSPPEYDHPYDGPLVITTARDQNHVRELYPNARFTFGIALGCTRRNVASCWRYSLPTPTSMLPDTYPLTSSATRSRTATAGRMTTAAARCRLWIGLNSPHQLAKLTRRRNFSPYFQYWVLTNLGRESTSR